MKKLIIILGIVLTFVACVSTKGTAKKNMQIAETNNDSTKYELVTFDFGFDSWYTRFENNGDDRDIKYYQMWNDQYISEWNLKAMSYHTSRFFNSTIEIRPYEINDLKLQRKLFYYFQYVENVLNINILNGRAPRLFY